MQTELYTFEPNTFTMKRTITITLLACIATTGFSQWNLNTVKEQAEDKVDEITGGGEAALTEDEIIGGLKEALEVGTNNSVAVCSVEDGFFGDDELRIPFPPEAQDVKDKVEAIGMEEQVNEFVLTLNRAAEQATKDAAPIFVDAITGMSIGDGMSILKGEDDAATQYLNTQTHDQLVEKFTPIVEQAIESVEVTKYWEPIITTYNKMPLVEDKDPDLVAYVTDKAIDGLFLLIAKEELKIREDPLARVTDLLAKVFGD